MRRLVLLVVCPVALALPATVDARPDGLTAAQRRAIERDRAETWHWQRLMGHRRTRRPTAGVARAAFWRRQARRTRRLAARPPHLREWLCIHRYEGRWNANTGNGYYGGLQMDVTFQRTYGAHLLWRKGTADRWTPLEQMWVAERAHRSGRGFHPWPNTARYCGLL
jgi:hypothetical protein